MCIPKSNHKVLIDSCYPAPKNLASAAPEYRPNSNELSRLAFYCSSKPAKLAKVGKVLELKAAQDAKAVTGQGVPSEKAKSSLMITLGVFKELVNECRRDLNFFSRSVQNALFSALAAAQRGAPGGKRDAELTARAASCFYALANYMDLSSASIDAEIGNNYLALLRQFGSTAVEVGSDDDETCRTRIIGLGALAGAVGSDALYTYSFAQQASIILPALLANIAPSSGVPVEFLRQESTKASKSSPAFGDYAAHRRPLASRRAPSLKGAPPGSEKAPGRQQVASAALGTLHSLLAHADGSHVSATMASVLSFLDGKVSAPSGGRGAVWADEAWCRWLAETLASWPALQYRFVVLTALAEYLVEEAEGPSSQKHLSLVRMVTAVLQSKLTLVGLSTTELAGNLLGLLVRRAHQDTRDRLLPPLVESVGALGTHIYYADQLNDVAEEIASRLVALQLPTEDETGATANLGDAAKVSGGSAARKPLRSNPESRLESIRALLYALVRLVDVANAQSGEVKEAKAEPAAAAGAEGGGLQLGTSGSRSRISPDVLAQVLPLLAHPSAAVRSTCAQALVRYLDVEAKPLSASAPSADATAAAAAAIGGPDRGAAAFAHALGASGYVAAASDALYDPNTARESPLESLPLVERANADGRRAASLPAGASPALPLDFSGLERLVAASLEAAPVATTLHALPALLALGEVAATSTTTMTEDKRISDPRRRAAAQTLVANVLAKAGKIWDISSLQELSTTSGLPELPPAAKTLVVPAAQAKWDEVQPSSPRRSIGRSAAISALSGSRALQSATKLSSQQLSQWLARDWSVQMGVDDAVNAASPFAAPELELAGGRNVLDLSSAAAAAAAPTGTTGGGARSIRGSSVAGGASIGTGAAPPQPTVGIGATTTTTSVATTSAPRGVGVEDLREALGNRAYGSAAAARRQTLASSSTSSSAAAGAGATPSEGDAAAAAGAKLSSPVGSAAERRASRRVSRRGSASKLASNGTTSTSDGGQANGNGGGGGLLASVTDALGNLTGGGGGEGSQAAAGASPSTKGATATTKSGSGLGSLLDEMNVPLAEEDEELNDAAAAAAAAAAAGGGVDGQAGGYRLGLGGVGAGHANGVATAAKVVPPYAA